MTKTLIIVILDESGSMGPKKADVLGGFNNFIVEQKKLTTDTGRLYLLTFNTVVNVVHKGIPLELIPELTSADYTPGGGTALYDAIAEGVRLADKDKDPDERVICVIMTDGEENSSRETTLKQVKDIITGHETQNTWTFVYIGENPERWARDTGSSRGNAMRYRHSNVGQNFSHGLNVACLNLRGSNESRSDELLSKDSNDWTML